MFVSTGNDTVSASVCILFGLDAHITLLTLKSLSAAKQTVHTRPACFILNQRQLCVGSYRVCCATNGNHPCQPF